MKSVALVSMACTTDRRLDNRRRRKAQHPADHGRRPGGGSPGLLRQYGVHNTEPGSDGRTKAHASTMPTQLPFARQRGP